MQTFFPVFDFDLDFEMVFMFSPSGARVSGIVEESPGRLEYEVALFRETTNSGGARSVPEYVTGINSQELAVDQAVPIGTRLQLRAKISPESGNIKTFKCRDNS